MGTLVISYDVEAIGHPEITSEFLRTAQRVHEEQDAPCTLYLVGEVVEENTDDLEMLSDNSLFDLAQCTYSHLLLKTVCQYSDGETKVFQGGSLEQIDEEIGNANRVLSERLGVDCIGLAGPFGYYRGFQDRPDILEILDRHGIRYCRTYARNEHDWQPVSFGLEPFWYTAQGFDHILEFPVQGWQDVMSREYYGWENVSEYIDFLKTSADEAAQRDIVWSYCQRDWSSIKEDPEMSIITSLIEHARSLGLVITSQQEAYDTIKADYESEHDNSEG